MRPIRLELEGFTCFTSRQEINFEPLDLFSLSGPTGSGKTSLIDAIIYALYGSTPRIGGKGLGDLISQSSDRVTVLLEFRSGADLYRISRSMRRMGNTVKSDRRLEKKVGDDWEPVAHTDSDVKERIEAVVGLDFDGFTRAVVLPQGEFDRFLKGEPRERRKILSDLLRLQKYERMRQRAGSLAREARTRSQTLAQVLEGSEYQEATSESEKKVTAELKTARSDKKETESLQTSIKDILKPLAQKLQEQNAEFERTRKRAEERTGEVQKFQIESKDKGDRLSDLRQKRSELEKELSDLRYDSDLHLKLTSAISDYKQRTTFKSRVKEAFEKERKERELLDDLQREEKELTSRLAASQEQLKKVRDRSKKVSEQWANAKEKIGTPEQIESLGERHEQSQRDRAKMADLEEELAALKVHEEEKKKDLAEQRKGLEKHTKGVSDAEANLEKKRRLHAAMELRSQLNEGEECPVCEQPVARVPSIGDLDELKASEAALARAREARDGVQKRIIQLESELQGVPSRRSELEKRRDELRADLKALQDEVQKKVGEARDYQEALGKLKRVQEERREAAENTRTEAEEVEKKHSQLTSQAEVLKERLKHSNKSLEECTKELARLHQELEELDAKLSAWEKPDEIPSLFESQEKAKARHSELQKELDELNLEAQNLKQEQEVLKSRIKERQEEIAELEKVTKELKADLEAKKKEFSKQAKKLKLEPAENQVEWIEEEARRISDLLNDIAVQVARLEGKLEQIQKLRKQKADLRREIKECEGRANTAEQLANLLRSDRFIQFILDGVFARLCQQGTRHLNQLSSDRYSFVNEESEFQVADHWNADEKRPVHTLSGGETFLASLSLALALSESLDLFSSTEREMIRLESLFLDEGFSTLDAETLDIVVQGIESLAAEDRMIGVVSHLPELADRFPNRIVVNKGVGGSQVVVE